MSNTDAEGLATLISQRLQAARRRAGLTQTEVAAKIGVKSNTLSGWEAGMRMPRAVELHLLAKAYRCTSDYLVGAADYPTELPIGEILIDLDMVQRILRADTEIEIAKLVDWDPQMLIFWQVVRRGTRPGSRQEVQTLLAKLAEHVRTVAPGLWREYEDCRRDFKNGQERSWMRLLGQDETSE